MSNSEFLGNGHPTQRLLLVEDDLHAADGYREALQSAGYALDVATSLDEAHLLITGDTYSGLVINVALPGGDGLEIVRRLRELGHGTRVLALSSLNTTSEVVRCFEAGADEFASYPVDREELRARVGALMRAWTPEGNPLVSVVVGNLRLSRLGRRVTCGAITLDLTEREYSLVEFLMRRPGDTLSRAELLEGVWPGVVGGSNLVEARLVKLRRKLRAAGANVEIRTRRNLGYSLEVKTSHEVA